MNADTVAVLIKTSSSGAKTTALVIYPLEDGDIVANMTQVGGQTASAAGAVTFPGTIASTTNITAGTITTATNVTNAVTVGTNNDKTGYSLSTAPPTAAAIADAIWDETLGDHLTAGSTGAALNAAGSAGDPWTTTLPGAYTGSQAGKILADILVDTGTTLQAELDGIQADTEDIQGRLPASLVSGRIDASVGAMASNVLTAAALAADAVTEIQTGLATTANVAAVETDTQDIQSRLPAALVSGRIDASVGAMASSVLTAAALATDAVGEIADGVWDEAYSGHTTAGSFGKLMDTLRKANYVTEGSVAAGGTPTTTVFRTNLTEPTGTFDNQTLLFITGTLAGESAPIEAYSVTNGQITLGDALTATPTAADEFVILPDHVHPLGEIATATVGATIEGTETLQGVLRLVRAATVGKLAGAATNTVTIRDAADTKNRITATVDADGNRSAVTTDAT
jgi:hypothetical protein